MAASGSVRNPALWRDPIILTLLLFAVALRLYLALETTFLFDEDRQWIKVALSISFDPANLHLPVRAIAHPALPAYFIKLGSYLLGENALGFRLFSLIAGIGTIVLAAKIAVSWLGIRAARWVTLLLAFNEYHAGISVLAIQKSYYLLFCIAAIWAFHRFLSERRVRFLYLASLTMGLAFLCYEIAFLMIPVAFATLLLTPHRDWLLRKEPYIALVAFFIVASPDLFWNLLTPLTDELEAGYGDHLSRITGIRLNYAPFTFYGRTLVREALGVIGLPFYDHAPEYASMNWVFGLVLGGGVLSMTLREIRSRDDFRRFLVLLFWIVFLFFMLIRTEAPAGKRMDSILWLWVDVTLLSAVLLTAQWLDGLNPDSGEGSTSRLWRYLTNGVVTVAVVLAIGSAAASRLHLPSHTVGFCRGNLWPPDGRMVALQAEVSSCLLCDQDPEVLLESIRIENGDIRPAAAGADVAGADFGTADREFRLRARLRPDESFERYIIDYSWSQDARKRQLSSVYMPVHSIPNRIPFWACSTTS